MTRELQIMQSNDIANEFPLLNKSILALIIKLFPKLDTLTFLSGVCLSWEEYKEEIQVTQNIRVINILRPDVSQSKNMFDFL